MPEIIDRPAAPHAPPSARRFETLAPIYLQFPGEEQPLSAQLGNISEKGMFVISEITYPASTEFNFRINDPDPRLSVTGRGQIAWRRQLASGEQRPAGMGCEILRLTEDSRAALDHRLVTLDPEEIFRSPPDRRSLTQEISRQDIHETLSKQQFQRPEYFRTMGGKAPRRKEMRLSPPFWILSGLALLAVAAFGLHRSGLISLPTLATAPSSVAEQAQAGQVTDSPSRIGFRTPSANASRTQPTQASRNDDSVPSLQTEERLLTEPGEDRLQAVNPPTLLTEGAVAATSGTQSSSPAQTGNAQTDAIRLAQDWASSWSNQELDDYLELYAETFRPNNGLSRRAWIRDRQIKLTHPDFIEVSLERFRFDGDHNAGTLTFLQDYRSNLMQDLVEKTLELVRENHNWKIVSEKSAPIS